MQIDTNDPTKKPNPYDLSAIANIRNRHMKNKHYENSMESQNISSDQSFSAYDLSNRPCKK